MPTGGTHSALARAVAATDSRKSSVETGGMRNLSAPLAMRWAFISGRKRTMRPVEVRKAFMPSKMPWP